MHSFQKKTIDCLGLVFIGVYLTWYCTPFFRALLNGSMYNILFMVFAFLGMFLSLERKKIDLTFSSDKTFFPVASYVIFLLFFSIAGLGNTADYVRVSFAFCLIYFIRFSLDGSPYLRNLLIYILLIFFVVYCTTIFGLIINPSAARILTSSSDDDNVRMFFALQNIGDIGFVQTMSLFSPFFIYNVFFGKKKMLNIILYVLLFLLLLEASFTIALGMFVVFSILTIVTYVKNMLVKTFLLFLLVGFFFVDFGWLFSELSQLIPNERISQKMVMLSNAITSSNHEYEGSRFDFYIMSLKTFISHPIGVGPYYFTSVNGIGDHSAILDDLARFGFFGVLFFIWLIRCYYKDVLLKWAGFFDRKLLIVFLANYFVFLLLNPGFRYATESVFVLLLVPYMPLLYEKNYSPSFLRGKL